MQLEEAKVRFVSEWGKLSSNWGVNKAMGLIQKENKMGCRKDFYKAEKDMCKVFQLIIEHRKRKELDPLLSLIDEMAPVKPQCEDSQEFCKVLKEIELFSNKADNALKLMLNSKSNWMTKSMSRMM